MTPTNQHVRLLSPEPVGGLQHHQLCSGPGADIVMVSIKVIDVGQSGTKLRLGHSGLPKIHSKDSSTAWLLL
jgi:hypothetical protein